MSLRPNRGDVVMLKEGPRDGGSRIMVLASWHMPDRTGTEDLCRPLPIDLQAAAAMAHDSLKPCQVDAMPDDAPLGYLPANNSGYRQALKQIAP